MRETHTTRIADGSVIKRPFYARNTCHFEPLFNARKGILCENLKKIGKKYLFLV